MPRALTIYLKSTDVPMRKALQKAVDELNFGLTLDEAYMPFEMAGYLPCILNGEDAGFDMWFKNRPSEFTVSPALEPQVGDRGVAILSRRRGPKTRSCPPISFLRRPKPRLLEHDFVLTRLRLNSEVLKIL
jgi:hypothetical protein